jgi:2-hydroxychromene-2-carboxylate isomerase
VNEETLVDFFFSPGSRYCYLAGSRVEGLEAETGCRVRWRAVCGPDIRALRGRDPFAGEPASGQYEWSYRRYDAECWADYYGIPFREPRSHHFDFRLLSRAAAAAARLGAAAPYGLALSAAVYASGAWPLDEALCRRVAEEIGLSASAFAEALRDPRSERDLVDNAAEAHRRGAFGVPTFFLGERLFWGNDRLPLLRHALLR